VEGKAPVDEFAGHVVPDITAGMSNGHAEALSVDL
jgi:hypothetical protein